MYSASYVDELFQQWKQQGLTKEELIVKTAAAEMGWPYVWGAVGAQCTPEKRQYYAGRSICPENEKKTIISGCQALNGSGKYCGGCQFYPDNMRTLIDDCQGFAKQVCSRVGISFQGGGCTSMWNNNNNWSEKGKLADMPRDKVCLVFIQAGNTMSHVGIYCGNGRVIHCSKYVREGPCPDKSWGWSHYAIPRGLGGDTPMPWRPTIRKGSSGDDVVYCQQLLMKLGYDLQPYGADGKFGNKTLTAVKAFQKSKGLNADGVVGPLTWDALENAVDPGEKMYTACIKHLTKAQADEIKRNYPQAEVTEE